jgi:hypothetical protein
MIEVKTVYVPGPNPAHHWCAWRDGPERARLYGWGRTEAEAIADLERLEGREKRTYPVLSESEEDDRDTANQVATLDWVVEELDRRKRGLPPRKLKP